MPAAVTPSGVRDGDPAALAGLCAVRGPSVVAYCRHVAGDADAGPAAADAFASFRAAVVATDDLADLNPEALLIGATRSAAARHAPRAPVGICAVVPLLLAGRAEKAIRTADRAMLDEHLEGCWNCRAPVARFEAAERAYRDPPDPVMDPAVVAAILAALAAAAPAGGASHPGHAANGAAPPEPAQQSEPADGPAADGGVALPATTVDQPTTEFQAPDVLDPDPVAAQVAANGAAQPGRPAQRSGLVPSLLGSLSLRPSGELTLPPRVDEPEPASELILEAVERPARARGRGATGARIPRAGRGVPAGKAKAAASPVLTLPDARGAARGARTRRSRSGMRLPILLPVVVVLLAVLVALFVSGVFGGDDPASSPRVAVPSDVPAQAPPADVVVVPGADSAGADDVESAKARERARERRRREAAAEPVREPAATTPSAAPAPPPAAPAPPPPPPPPPPAAADDSSRRVDAGNGATGAEQIPPAADTSTVPDLAPAPEPAPAP